MIITELTRRLGVEHPVIQAGMGAWTRAALVSAVSNGGALGTIGSIGHTPDAFAAEIGATRDATGRPFAVNLVCFDWAPFAAGMLDVAIEARVPIVTLSFGNPLPALERCKAAGLKTIVQVQDLAGARAAIGARPDVLIVQGNEAGGHTGRRGTLSFAAQVLDMAGNIPVAVAGGIANGRGLAAALAMGAGGAVMGTRFKATEEFVGEPHLKENIVASDGSDTIYDEIVDLAYGGPWPNGVTGRVLRNRFTDEWDGRDEDLKAAVAADPEPYGFARKLDENAETQLNWAGESSGLVESILPAAEVVRRTVREAEAFLTIGGGLVRGPTVGR